MSSGHASHKGTAAKPNTNANGPMDVDPQDAIPQEGYPFEGGAEGESHPAALERPGEQHPSSDRPMRSEPSALNPTVAQVDAQHAPRGEMGQKALARGQKVAMRLWEREEPGDDKAATQRNYETVGYVIDGRAELHLDGQPVIQLEPRDSWLVPQGIRHRYKILEPFTAVEATCPPAEVQEQA